MFLVYPLHGNIDHLKNKFDETSILLQKLVQFLNQSDQAKVGKTQTENARYGIEKAVLNHPKHLQGKEEFISNLLRQMVFIYF